MEKELSILEKMRELEREIDKEKEEKQTIKDIIKVDNIELSPMLKLKEAYIVEIENEDKEISYQLYTENGLIGVSNKEGIIELNAEYVDLMNEKLKNYGVEYLIHDERRGLDPQTLQEQSEEMQTMRKLEENQKEGSKEKTEEQQEKQEEEKQKKQQEQQKEQEEQEEQKDKQEEKQEEKQEKKQEKEEDEIDKMEQDLGCDISSCVRILDEEFSQEVLGYQTGHEDKYIAYSKSRNTFILVGKSGEHFEEIQDICGAQGGSQASSKRYMEYDEHGNQVEEEVPSFVMTRKDGKEGALAIDMQYGAICVSNLEPNENEKGKYTSEEINIGHSVKPSPDEIELEKQREEEKEQEQEEIDDDEDYDWSEGRAKPKH